jgi:hypothetical protein
MKIIFNGLDRPFELSNSRYGRKAWEVLFFAKHHSLYIYIERERVVLSWIKTFLMKILSEVISSVDSLINHVGSISLLIVTVRSLKMKGSYFIRSITKFTIYIYIYIYE